LKLLIENKLLLPRKKLARELDKAKQNLEDEKKETEQLLRQNKHLRRKVQTEKHHNEEEVHEIRILEAQTKDLEEEAELKAQDIDETTQVVRAFKRENMDLENERKVVEDDIGEELENKEKILNDIENKFISNVDDLQKKHVRTTKKIAKQKEAAVQEVELLADTLEDKKKNYKCSCGVNS